MPPVTSGTTILCAVASLLVGGSAATGARSLRGLSRPELDEACRRRKCEPLAREIMLGQHRVALGAECLLLICQAIFVSALAMILFSWPALAESSRWTQFAAVAISAGLLLVIADAWIPATVARVWGTTFVIATWPLWRSVSHVLAPLVIAAQQIERLTLKAAGRRPTTHSDQTLEGDARALLADGHRDGLLEEDAREMIEGVIQLGDAEVAQVMTPRTYMLSMRASLSLEEAVRFAISSGHTRIPVFDKNRDDIIGILHMKDLLPELMKSPESRAANVVELLRPAAFVPESKRLDELLQEFQQNRNHMAVVLDEFGGVSGVVTIEDVLEEIVGEIVDEYDEDDLEVIKSIDDRTAEALARVRIDEVNERLGTHLPDDGDFDTIGGFVFSHLGHIPAVGETITVDDVRLTVIDVTRRRIERVRIEVLDPSRA
jgi:CBS domain containing-hemolysin-like protein